LKVEEIFTKLKQKFNIFIGIKNIDNQDFTTIVREGDIVTAVTLCGIILVVHGRIVVRGYGMISSVSQLQKTCLYCFVVFSFTSLHFTQFIYFIGQTHNHLYLL